MSSASRAEQERHELSGRRRCACERCDAVAGRDIDRVGHGDDLERRLLAPRERRVRAVGQKDVGAALGHPFAVDAPRSGRRRRRGGPAGQLERFRAEPVERVGDAILLDPPKHLPRIVARGIRHRRRRGELDGRIEHALNEIAARDLEARSHQGAHRVAREPLGRPGLAGLAQLLRVLHVRRREHIRRLAGEKSVLEQPGSAEREADRCAGARGLELAPRLDERRAKAAGSEDRGDVGALCRRIGSQGERGHRRRDRRPGAHLSAARSERTAARRRPCTRRSSAALPARAPSRRTPARAAP